jgi:hypothetical protein
MTPRPKTLLVTLLWLVSAALALPGSPKNSSTGTAAATVGDFSGTYTFLREGEDLQINVQNGKLDGIASRYGDSETDKNVLLQHFFEKSSVAGDEVSFTTDKIHGVWFEFKGKVRRGDGKTAAEEGFYVLEGTITRYESGADRKPSAQSRAVQFRSLPTDFGIPLPGPKKK